jgi:hypothetical protein
LERVVHNRLTNSDEVLQLQATTWAQQAEIKQEEKTVGKIAETWADPKRKWSMKRTLDLTVSEGGT